MPDKIPERLIVLDGLVEFVIGLVQDQLDARRAEFHKAQHTGGLLGLVGCVQTDAACLVPVDTVGQQDCRYVHRD